MFRGRLRGWRYWRFKLKLHDWHQKQVWQCGITDDNTWHYLGCRDWVNPNKPEWEPPAPTVYDLTLRSMSWNGHVWIERKGLITRDPEGYEHWPTYRGWEIEYSNPFIGSPWIKINGQEFVLSEPNVGGGYTHETVIEGLDRRPKLFVVREQDSDDYKEVTIEVDV
jgi:hypothetical protein